MLRKEIETIIFDVDGALSEEVSWLKLTHGLGASADEHAQIFARMKANELTYPEAKGLLIKLWQDTGNANKEYMEEMFRSWDLKHDAVDTIDYLKGAYRVCLMSGAVDLYVAVVADRLGIEDWYANTELVWDDQGNLVDFHYHVDQAGRKLEHLREYVEKHGLDIKRCAVVGDGDSDIALFQELPYGIAVNSQPFPELEALAYKTISNLNELKEIF
jgi:HAD superfamily phosphoserine phosphatase-like hydrolase